METHAASHADGRPCGPGQEAERTDKHIQLETGISHSACQDAASVLWNGAACSYDRKIKPLCIFFFCILGQSLQCVHGLTM